MPKININDIVFDPEIYPRDKVNDTTVDRYVDRLMNGDEPPPVVVETELTDGKHRLFDGKHRLDARFRYNRWYAKEVNEEMRALCPEPTEEIEVEEVDPPEETEIPTKLWCVSFNKDHGDRLSEKENEQRAREAYRANPKITPAVIALCLGTCHRRVGEYIADLVAKAKEERKWRMEILRRLGWTQVEIGAAMGVTQQAIGKEIQLLPDSAKVVKTDIAKNSRLNTEKQLVIFDGVFDRHHPPLELAYALAVDSERDEAKRCQKLAIPVKAWDHWAFSACSELMGISDHPGRIPGQLICNVLYFYTKQNDFVIDPMAGGGTTADACLLMDRRCYCYDVDNRWGRAEIIEHDLAVDGWPDRTKKAKLIFWDPPYFNKQDDTRTKDGYGEKSISKLERTEYLEFFAKAFTSAHATVSKGTVLAFLMGDYIDYEKPSNSILVKHYDHLIEEAGWAVERWYSCPVPVDTLHKNTIAAYTKERKTASLNRQLIIARKP